MKTYSVGPAVPKLPSGYSIEDMSGPIDTPEIAKWTKEQIWPIIGWYHFSENEEFFIAKFDGKVVGVGMSDSLGTDVTIHVAPDHRGRGVGSCLLHRIEQRLVATGKSYATFQDAKKEYDPSEETAPPLGELIPNPYGGLPSYRVLTDDGIAWGQRRGYSQVPKSGKIERFVKDISKTIPRQSEQELAFTVRLLDMNNPKEIQKVAELFQTVDRTCVVAISSKGDVLAVDTFPLDRRG